MNFILQRLREPSTAAGGALAAYTQIPPETVAVVGSLFGIAPEVSMVLWKGIIGAAAAAAIFLPEAKKE